MELIWIQINKNTNLSRKPYSMTKLNSNIYPAPGLLLITHFYQSQVCSLLQCIKPTPLWSLSSTTVALRRIKSLSIFSSTSSIVSSQSALTEFLAFVNSLLNSLYSSLSSPHYASTKVLKPALAYLLVCPLVCSSNSLPFFESLSNTMLIRK